MKLMVRRAPLTNGDHARLLRLLSPLPPPPIPATFEALSAPSEEILEEFFNGGMDEWINGRMYGHQPTPHVIKTCARY